MIERKGRLTWVWVLTALALTALFVGCATLDEGQRHAAGKPYHHTVDGFRNPEGSPQRDVGTATMTAFMWRRLRESGHMPPIPAGHVTPPPEVRQGLAPVPGNAGITWLGHASYLISTAGKTIITDPFLSDHASPVPPLGPKRFVAPPLAVGDLPPIDIVVISHNHYDHLDAPTVEALPGKDRMTVVVPLGLGDFFRQRGYRDVREVDWHDEVRVGDIAITALPAVHFSRRTLFDRNRSLWMGVAIAASSGRIFFAGDTAYGPAFRRIGERYGPFDLALVPIGAYEPRDIMAATHVTPEEAVQIGRDIGARRLAAMHWGTIVLTEEPPFEPPQRFRASAAAAGYAADDVWVMRIGETRRLLPMHAAAD